MALTEFDNQILVIVGGQSPGYLISPVASAFMIEGHNSEEVEQALHRLEEMGYVANDEVVAQTAALDDEGRPIYLDDEHTEVKLVDALDNNGQPVILDEGWYITDAGKEQLA